MLKVMLDTCVLVDFFLIYFAEEKNRKISSSRLKRCKKLLIKYENAVFINVMSKWSKWELRKALMQKRLQNKFVQNGYTTADFGDAKKEIFLEEDELEAVNQAVFDIWKYSVKDTKLLEKEDFRKIEKLTKEGFDFMDCLLILQAKKSECDFFVTRDNKLTDNSKVLSKELGIEIIGLKEFLSKLKE